MDVRRSIHSTCSLSVHRLGPALMLAGTLAVTTAVPSWGASAPASRPSIAIVRPVNGSVVRGSTVTVQVMIHNFKLVQPVLKNPPALPADEGHVHWILDNVKNFSLTRDVTASTSHTWTNVAPGQHTVIAYLATGIHTLYPGTRMATVHIQVVGSAAHAPKSPAVSQGPHSGGANGVPGNDANETLIVLTALAACGIGFALRRYAPVGAGSGVLVQQAPMRFLGPAVLDRQHAPAPASVAEPGDRGDAVAVAADEPIVAAADSTAGAGVAARVDNDVTQEPAGSEAAPRSGRALDKTEEIDVARIRAIEAATTRAEPASDGAAAVDDQPAPASSATMSEQAALAAQATEPVDAARQIVAMVEGMAQQVEGFRAERAEAVARVEHLEARLSRVQAVSAVSLEDVRAVQDLVAALQQAPYDVRALMRVPEHMSQLSAVVEACASLHEAVETLS